MKMITEITIGKKHIGRIELVGTVTQKNGKTQYAVTVTREGVDFKFCVLHRREDGPFKLMEIICRKVTKMIDEYYSLPKDKVENGFIRSSDVPERYRTEFGKFFGVGTVSLMPRKPCPEGCLDLEFEKKSETAYNVWDLTGFLENRRYGYKPLWD